MSPPLLRPAFTRMLAEWLVAGDCLNLTSPHGQGRRRTLKDLRHCLPSQIRILQANLRHYPQDPAALLGELCVQASCDLTGDLGALLDLLEKRPEKSLLILHNFDELERGSKSGYDDRLFAQLNSICDRLNISLLCVSEHIHHDWLLNIEEIELPPLSEEQIITELRRRGIDDPRLAETAASLLQQDAPYSALDTIQPKT